ncbi:TIGR02186 family protein [Pelagibacterium halotolerans]|uniref:Transmembrane protein n=1 Tax=Pelagibacterium halotolerans (strain DSM 22347 / JCM 15775 / CGMCC 1.7692 / B2) TaxID=1082931 RepID=G4R7E0_PELHB|nr:TIGR02186 family protein [Pelagibacterium halotolerans]AEQ51276.1 hypothetical protein KKY_1248 [Pelagibacterium halotolerans B2]SEA66663.1 conserved hypothetical protein [Pelagibacterium halotolerans]
MMRLIFAAIAVAFSAFSTAGAAHAQGVVFANSDPLVTIHSTFTGQTITLFGNIEPGSGSVPEAGPYDVMVLVRGPASDRVIRIKERQFGLVLNADQAIYRDLPGYYAILASRPFDQILSAGMRADPRTALSSLVARARSVGDGERFDAELIRMMEEAGLFIEAERGVAFLSSTTFTTRILLPSSVPNGSYLAQVLVVADGELVGSGSTTFSVRTQGFERFLSRAATTSPFLYGLAAVLTAIGTGWLGGVLFKR